MRILLWHGYLLGGTGSNVYTRALAREWSLAGHDVTVVLPGYRSALERASEAKPSGPPIEVPWPLGTYRLEPYACSERGVRTVFLRCDQIFSGSTRSV